MTSHTQTHAALLDTLWYQTLSLGVVTLLAGAALALAHLATDPAIRAAEARDVAASLAQVLPPGTADNDLLADTLEIPDLDGQPLTVHRARRNGQVVAVIFQVSSRGYAGPIQLVMGVGRDGRVTGVRVTRHGETPGLGDKIETARHPWIQGFAGRSLDDPAPARWAVRKDGGDFDQFAGATITPRAVVAAVKQGLELHALRHDSLFDTPSAPPPAQSGEGTEAQPASNPAHSATATPAIAPASPSPPTTATAPATAMPDKQAPVRATALGAAANPPAQPPMQEATP
ncbi:MAG: RnfABCDGE type electron transport complex subunit G [Rhodocyclaceae bacterium]